MSQESCENPNMCAPSDDGWPEAMEQYLHWRELGLSDVEMLLQVSITPPAYVEIDAHLVLRALAGEWRKLPHPEISERPKAGQRRAQGTGKASLPVQPPPPGVPVAVWPSDAFHRYPVSSHL